MQKFFICTDGVAKGPYQLEDLLNHGINENDLIWNRDWGISKYAFEIDELKEYFKKNITISKPSFKYDIAGTKSNSAVIKNIILFSLLFVLAGLIVYYFSTY